MAGLADTISRLNRLSRDLSKHQGIADRADRLTDIDTFGSNPGELRARIYTPDHLEPGAALVVVLHGCTQNAASYNISSGWSVLADKYGFAVLFPEQRRSNNPNLCFNWYVSQDAERGSGEALSIKQMVDTVCGRYATDPGKVFVTGLSAGGAMASIMLATYPDVFAGGAIIAGLPYGMASSLPAAFQLMAGRVDPDPFELMSKVRSASSHRGSWPKVSVWHGTADHTVDASNAMAVVDQWRLIHNVPAEPSQVEFVNGFPRRSWCDDEGRKVIEEYRLPGMAHGTPLDTGSGIGTAAPYMLDVGICSTLESLRFWGLTDSGPSEQKQRHNSTNPVAQAADAALSIQPAKPRIERLIRTKPIPMKSASAGVGKVIEDALRAAGLMR